MTIPKRVFLLRIFSPSSMPLFDRPVNGDSISYNHQCTGELLAVKFALLAGTSPKAFGRAICMSNLKKGDRHS
jgi:hypothetical protein